MLPGAISRFGAAVTPKLRAGVGEPEDQLRAPIEDLFTAVGRTLGLDVVLVGETLLTDMAVKPDYTVFVDGTPVGYVEVKAPGKGADPTRFRIPHDRRQWQKLSPLPNLLYTDGNEWGRYEQGEPDVVQPMVRLLGQVQDAGNALTLDGSALGYLLAAFLRHTPTAPRTASDLARSTAGLCRLLRDQVIVTIDAEGQVPGRELGPFTRLATEWRALLFPGVSSETFADFYAQTVTFALLLARAEDVMVDPADFGSAARDLGRRHGLLGRALALLTEEDARRPVATSLSALGRVISVVNWAALGRSSAVRVARSPWRYFYEDFLAVYDPKLREATGSYYTPHEVVAAQVRLVDDVVRERLGKPLGLANDGVVTLDPAMGTGSYLTGVVDLAAVTVGVMEGQGNVADRLADLRSRLIGFEIQAGPYAVAEVLLGEAFRSYEAPLPHGYPRRPIRGRNDLRFRLRADSPEPPRRERDQTIRAGARVPRKPAVRPASGDRPTWRLGPIRTSER